MDIVRYISLLLFIGLAWGQGQQDTLFLQNGLKYEVNFEKIEKDTIWFIPTRVFYRGSPVDAFSAQRIEIIKIKKLVLYDGTKIINNGILIDINDIHQVAIDAAKKNNEQPSIGTIIKRSCGYGCASGLIVAGIMPDFMFLAFLLGTVYPNIALIKKNERLANVEPVYPVSINTDEEKKQYLITYNNEKKKIANRAIMKSCIIGTTGFLIVMHILVYIGDITVAG